MSTWSAAVLCALGLAGPVYALIEAPTRGFWDPLILATLLGGDRTLRALPRLGGADAPPDAAASALPPAELLVREPRDVHRLRRAHDAELLPDAVPAADRGLLAVPERPRDRADHDRHVLPLPARRPAVDALRAALLHGRRAADLRGVDRLAPLPLTRLHLLDAAPAGAAPVLVRPRDGRRAADGHGARRRGAGRRRDRLRSEQRRCAGGEPPGYRGRGRGHSRRSPTSSTCRATGRR